MEMRARAILSIAVIAASVGATVLAWRLRPPPAPPPAESNEPVFDFDARAVRSLALASWQGTLSAEQAGGRWQVRAVTRRRAPSAQPDDEPVVTPSPEEVDEVIGSLVRDIVKLPVIDRFPRDGRPLADFGLGEPQAVIAFGLQDGNTRRLEVGSLTLSSAALYARAAPPDDVLQIGTLLMSSIDAALYRLRALAPPLAAPDGAPPTQTPAPSPLAAP